VTYARQFALPFPQDTHYTAAAFLPGKANEAAMAWLDRPETWPGRRLAVHGEAGTGKTHFLHLFAARARAALLPVEALRPFAALPNAPSLAIDDADTVPDPRILLHVLNSAAERGTLVMLTGRTPPAAWAHSLADLDSRLRAMASVELHLPEDGLLRALLAQLLAERQLAVPERVQDYLLERLPRTGAALREAAARLDRLALAEGGHVTRRMAALVVNEPELGPSLNHLPPGDLLAAQ
jgi:chromosomal replication initiation ATPase DnaA